MTPKEIIISHTKDGVIDIPIPVGCMLISMYIQEIKGINVILNSSIQDLLRMQLYHTAMDTVINYYLSK